MKDLLVDAQRCVGAGHCARLAPGLFDQDSQTGVVVWRGGEVDRSSDDELREVVALCPSGALRWSTEGD
ncbi:ferredoxin [Solwaraspora sp. WMMD406]|uniref:ferredoxin n=1 Tax=Solwaraspora sp. WMMD406 TaxID=3016095 RepID=UPI002416C637|nr:ferredoxin [Solwaraspora sp. WMMD406]MDG4762636.1 ferredoxin [Solwaraspora sp. WMMD406]